MKRHLDGDHQGELTFVGENSFNYWLVGLLVFFS